MKLPKVGDKVVVQASTISRAVGDVHVVKKVMSYTIWTAPVGNDDEMDYVVKDIFWEIFKEVENNWSI